MLINNFRKSCLLLLLCLPGLAAAEFRSFSNNSLDEITAVRNGQPFLLVLWSIDCPPCLKELEQIGQLRAQFSPNSLVLISADNMAYADEAQQVLIRYGLDDAENWLFSGNFPERLRYQIDPNWYGELPRAYFYDANHDRVGKSGALDVALIHQWIAAAKQMEKGTTQ